MARMSTLLDKRIDPSFQTNDWLKDRTSYGLRTSLLSRGLLLGMLRDQMRRTVVKAPESDAPGGGCALADGAKNVRVGIRSVVEVANA
jgi:hypothetical protein